MTHATVDAHAAATELEAMRCRRDGTLVAFLAMIPLRTRACVGLEIGRSLLLSDSRFTISLSGDMTKNDHPWQCELPDALTSLFREYVFAVRPWLMARTGQGHSMLWVNEHGTPFRCDYFGYVVSRITTRLTGVRVSPHLFRDAAATTLSRLSPNAANLIRPVLAHTSDRTAERHYIQASSIEAGRNYAELIRRKKGKSR